MSDFGEWLPKVLITLKTNICFTVFLLAPKLCNYRSAKNHVFTRNKKVDTPQRIVIKNRNKQKLFNAGHQKHLSFSISWKNPWVWGCWCDTNENRKITLREIPYGLAVRIPGFHPGGPGSTPGMGTIFLFCFNNSGFSVVYSYVWEWLPKVIITLKTNIFFTLNRRFPICAKGLLLQVLRPMYSRETKKSIHLTEQW